MSDDWEPLGGVSASYHTNTGWCFTQAVVKKEKPASKDWAKDTVLGGIGGGR